jgi:uncharacterized membrane protein YhfC
MTHSILSFKKHKVSLLILGFFGLVICFFVVINVGHLERVDVMVTELSGWIKSHRPIFWVWHGLLMAAIFVGWGKKIDRQSKARGWSKAQTQKMKRFRYVLILTFLMLDGLAFGVFR